MSKVTEIAPARFRRLQAGYTVRTEPDGWTIVTATSTGTEVFAANDPEFAKKLAADITAAAA
jgi:hypothetical protein